MALQYAEISTELSNQNEILYFGSEPFSGKLQKQTDDGLTESLYVNGKKHGIQKLYYQSGELRQVSIYTQGVKNGRTIGYYTCGLKSMNANFVNGELDGSYEEWNKNGMPSAMKTYFKGKLISVRSNLTSENIL